MEEQILGTVFAAALSRVRTINGGVENDTHGRRNTRALSTVSVETGFSKIAARGISELLGNYSFFLFFRLALLTLKRLKILKGGGAVV